MYTMCASLFSALSRRVGVLQISIISSIIRDGRRWGEREIVYLSLHCHHQKMGSDESHFNVSLILRDKVTRQCPQTTTFLKKKKNRGLSAYQPNGSPLGQTGSQCQTGNTCPFHSSIDVSRRASVSWLGFSAWCRGLDGCCI